jgi:glycerol-3-phosphate dehydrogenase
VKLAVVGAGINGIMSAWALRDAGHEVDLYEQGEPMSATSRASTKLLHGGLRYLEHGDFGLVREGLLARRWWLSKAPELTRSIKIAIPVYRGAGRGRWTLKAGLALYDLLAGRSRLCRHGWLDPESLNAQARGLKSRHLRGAYVFCDGQMDDHALGMWALDQILTMGVRLHSNMPVQTISPNGMLVTLQDRKQYDGIVNASGPWSVALLERSDVNSRHKLELIRGSHLLVPRRHEIGFLLESPDDGRVCFVLPYGQHTLIGTTEVPQRAHEPIECNAYERDYLLRLYNEYFEPKITHDSTIATFSGVRPLVATGQSDSSAITRESAIEIHGNIATIFGGKWTTSRETGLRVAKLIQDWETSTRNQAGKRM